MVPLLQLIIKKFTEITSSGINITSTNYSIISIDRHMVSLWHSLKKNDREDHFLFLKSHSKRIHYQKK